jgi:LacI family transcriptional regulator
MVAMSGVPDGSPARVTITEVALRAGVSRSTSSRALSGTGYVAAQVRERVRRAADELGYVVDVTARSLKQGSSLVIGAVVSDLRHPAFADLASGVAHRARSAGFTMMLVDDAGEPAGELGAVEALVASRVAGVVLTPIGAASSAFLRRRGVPVVEVGRRFGDGDAVVVDDRAAARAAARQLLGLGHRRIALLVDERESGRDDGRRQGYLDAAGSDARMVAVPASGPDAAAGALSLLRGPRRPTAILAADGRLAEGVWRAAKEAGLRIPDRLSLAALEDAPWMSMVDPPVTAVVHDPAALGGEAVSLLLRRIATPDAQASVVTVPAGLALRGSTARPSE